MKDMNKLKGLRCYLAGPMDFAPDRGIGWRNDIIPFLTEMGVDVIDPTKRKHTGGFTESEKADQFKALIAQKDFESAQKIAREIRCDDLRYVDISDFLIVYLNPSIPMCGVWEELFTANKQKKPILVMWDAPVERLPLWLVGTLPTNYFYFSWDHLKNVLMLYNNNTITMDKRWVLLSEDF